MQTKREIAIEFIKKHPANTPNLKLARMLNKKEPLLFNSEEHARTTIRTVQGKTGGDRKVYLKDKSVVKVDDKPRNPYKLPLSDESEYKPFIFRGHKKIGILSDIHIPYHNVEALTAAIQYLKKEKIDGLLLNGDCIDFYGISRFSKDPRKRSFAGELAMFKELMIVFERELKCKIYFKVGNHEVRYEHFLYQKAGELIGVEEFEFENIIQARAKGIQMIGSTQYMKMNKLNGIHGHEYIGGISAPVNVARGLYLRGKVSAFQGHNHSSSTHTESDMDGKIVTTHSIGCLCSLSPGYMPLNKWNAGCAMVELDPNGEDYEFHNKRIYRGKVF